MWRKRFSMVLLVFGLMMTVVATSAEALQLTGMDSVMRITNNNGSIIIPMGNEFS